MTTVWILTSWLGYCKGTPYPLPLCQNPGLLLRKAISGREHYLGLTKTPRRSRRHPTVVLTSLDQADNINLLCELRSSWPEQIEAECVKVGLWLNAKKTEVIDYNIPLKHPLLTTTVDTALHSWVNSTEQDLKVRNALAWRALNMPHGTPTSHIKSNSYTSVNPGP